MNIQPIGISSGYSANNKQTNANLTATNNSQPAFMMKTPRSLKKGVYIALTALTFFATSCAKKAEVTVNKLIKGIPTQEESMKNVIWVQDRLSALKQPEKKLYEYNEIAYNLMMYEKSNPNHQIALADASGYMTAVYDSINGKKVIPTQKYKKNIEIALNRRAKEEKSINSK